MVAINEILTSCCDATKRRDRGGRCVENGNIPNGTTDSLWQGWQTTEERNPFGGSGSTDTPIKQYVWGTYIDECIQLNLLVAAGPQSLPAGAYYLLPDLLYRAVALVNSSGQIVEAYDNDAYGNTLIFTAPGPDGVWFTDDDVQSNYGANSVIYCGYSYNPETENYYVRNRYYSPVLGRWISRDPIGIEGGVNLYGYADSSPAGNADQTGTATWNQCCPKAFALLNKLASIAGPAEDSVATTLKSLAETIGQLRLTAALGRANAANAKESLLGLLFGNVATVELTGAVAVKAAEIKELTGLITNSRLVKAGTKGFVALSRSAEIALKIADASDIYATIAAWGASEFINVADIRQTAQIATMLGSSVSRAEAVYKTGAARLKNIDNFVGGISNIFSEHNGKPFSSGDVSKCDALVKTLEKYLPLARQAAHNDQDWARGGVRSAWPAEQGAARISASLT